MALTALVIGGAPCRDADIALAGAVDLRVGINDAGYTFPDLAAVATLHPEHVPGWRAKREAAGFPNIAWISFHQPECGVTIWRPERLNEWTRGSSSLYAVGVALHRFGADLVILAGCPMDEGPNVYRDEPRWAQFQRYRIGWERLAGELRGRVVSCSGWTADLLGRVECE